MTRILGPAFLIGIVLGTLLPPFPLAALALLLLSGLGLAAVGTRTIALAALLLIAAVLGMSRYHGVSTVAAVNPFAGHLGQAVTLRGWVASEPVRSERSTRLKFRAEAVWVDEAWQPLAGEVWVSLPPRFPARYGMAWDVSGRLAALASVNSPGYQRYLERLGAQALLGFPDVTAVPGARGQPLLRALFGVKERLLATMADILPQPHAPLLQGILLGARAGIPTALRQAFDLSGTTHLIAISGFNMTIVAFVLEGISRRLVGRRALWLSMGGVALYTILVGANPAVVRAAVMAILLLFAATLGRDRDPWSALSLAAVAMCAWDPNILWDVGFQLSVAATAGLLALSDPLHARLRRLPQPLADIVAPTLAAQLFVLPILIYVFGRVSPFFLVSNLLAMPLIPWIMLSGAVATAVGTVHTTAGQVVAWSAYLPLEAFMRIAAAVSRWPSFAVSAGALLPALLAGLAAALVVVWARRPFLAAEPRRLAPLPLSWLTIFSLGTVGSILLVLWANLAAELGRQPGVTVLERSLGSAVVIETPRRPPLLIGYREPPSRFELDRVLPIWQRDTAFWLGGSETRLPNTRVASAILPDDAGWLALTPTLNARLPAGDRYRIALNDSAALLLNAENAPETQVIRLGNRQVAIIQANANVQFVPPVQVVVVQGPISPARLTYFLAALRPDVLVLDEPWPDASDARWQARGVTVLRPPSGGYLRLRWNGAAWHVFASEREEL